MAGLIAAVANNHIGIVGIAPLARLEVFEACWQLAPDSDAAACNTFTLAQALAAALASGAPLVNLSIAGPADPLLSALVETRPEARRDLRRRGCRRRGGFPDRDPGRASARAAASIRCRRAHSPRLPSTCSRSVRPAQYDFESGSSVAAAEITGVIALLMSASADATELRHASPRS